MRLASEQALERVLRSWEGVVANRPSDAIGWAGEIFAAGRVLDTSSALLRSITDPSRLPQARADLVHHVFDGKVSAEIVELLAGLARERFSVAEDYREAVTASGVETLLMSAQFQNRLDIVEEELYRATGVLKAERELRRALEDSTPELERRHGLVTQIFGDWAPETVALVKFAVSRNESVVPQLQHWVGSAGRRSQHLVAIVTAAQPLDADQEERLTRILSQRYGKPVEIHVGIDPAIVGGLRIVIGSDVIDGSLAARINNVKSVFTD